MGFLTDLATGFAQLIADEADASQNITWQPDGTPYATSDTGIYLRKLPAVPNRALALTVYGLGDDAVYGDSTLGLQILSRSEDQDPTDAETLDDAVADVLLGRYPMTLATDLRIQILQRSSGPTSLGLDDNKRWTLASNYQLDVHHPAPHRL